MGNMTEPTLQPSSSGIPVPPNQKNMTLSNTNEKRKFVNSERQNVEDVERLRGVADPKEGFNSSGKNEARS